MQVSGPLSKERESRSLQLAQKRCRRQQLDPRSSQFQGNQADDVLVAHCGGTGASCTSTLNFDISGNSLRTTGTSFCYNVGRYVTAFGVSILGPLAIALHGKTAIPGFRLAAMVLADLLTGDMTPVGRPQRPHQTEDEVDRLRVAVSQLEHALAARVTIEQAIGVIAERQHLAPRAAFERLSLSLD